MKIRTTVILCALLINSFLLFSQEDFDSLRKKAETLQKDGNYKEALVVFEKLALSSGNDQLKVSGDFLNAINCMRAVNQEKDLDEFLEKAIAVHAKNWRLLKSAADTFISGNHFGFMISGTFERGGHRGGGKMMNAGERDRIRALQLYVQAMPLADQDKNTFDSSSFYISFAGAFLNGRGNGSDSWQLQSLSDLTSLPDYDEGYYGRGYRGFEYGGEAKGAPVDEDGNPIYYKIPESFEKASNDGERWRWLLEHASTLNSATRNQTLNIFADFLRNQFGVQTIAYGRGFRNDDSDGESEDSAPYALHTLSENETIAKLATGIKRFKLPDEFNYIKIYRKISKSNDPLGESSLNILADEFSNRRQYPMAAELWEENIKRFNDNNNWKHDRLEQIIGNWGSFENSKPLGAGKSPELLLRFRNAKHVSFEAFKVKVPELLAAVKSYLKSDPKELDWRKLNIDDIGRRIVFDKQSEFIGEKTAGWDMDLKPRENHFDTSLSVKAPFKEPGAYLINAKFADGNTARILIWLTDTVIVKKPLSQSVLYYFADAETGKPVPNLKLEFFGYKQEYLDQKKVDKPNGRQYRINTSSFTAETDENGFAVIPPGKVKNDFVWLVNSNPLEKNFAYLGFSSIWFNQYYDAEYNQAKVFTITDRPVYRPAQKVNFKIWARHAKYDIEESSTFAFTDILVSIRNPKGEEIYKKTLKADEFGGVESDLQMEKNATLGVYTINGENLGGGGTFRLEEYKKPEYEVTVEAPTEPVKLGDEITATVKAKYYFGAPVTNAKVKYKVMRYSHNSEWYPPRYWDWFYGPGYWWFACDYYWYPRWNEWGCKCPVPWWIPRNPAPPELVMENEVPIGEDGTVKLKIDSSTAKALHGDSDHRYEITAEVVDLSRRTIYGKGSVIAARKPFSVYAWVDRGFYRAGDAVTANFAARTVDGKPVKGEGTATLFSIKYDADGNPSEKALQTWELPTDVEGKSSLQIKAATTGQFRVSYKVTDLRKNTIEGAYVFTVRGDGEKSDDFRFNDIEIVNDKPEYSTGEKAFLQINTARQDSTVVYFLRPSNSVYLMPKLVRVKGKTALEEIEISKKDMPNFFVEAITVSNGRIFTAVKEIAVPPEKRVLNVDILPSKEKYKPGEKAKAKIKITDLFGKPVTSTAVVTIYDKSVEYISGGSNVPEIKEFFWKWRRGHNVYQETNMERYSYNLMKENEKAMGFLGIFGNIDNEPAMPVLGGGVRRAAKGMMMAKSSARAENRMEMECNDKADGIVPCAPMAEAVAGAEAEGGSGGEGEAAVVVRRNFADTALWMAKLNPDKNGEAEIELSMPENLTAWKIKVWSMGHGTKVGQGEAEILTSKDFIVRLQAPRFFVEKDEVVLSAIVHNYYKDEKIAKVAIELEGGCIEVLNEKSTKNVRDVKVAPNGEVRVDWRVKVLKEGEEIVRMKAVTEGDSDAMEMKFPVYVHGMMKTVSYSGSMRPENESANFAIDVPAERRPAESVLEIRYSPSLACAMVDALPYLSNYPYGCTEQTLNRFLPTVITQKVLKDMGLNLKDIRDKRTNLNAQEIGDDKERAKQWKRYNDTYPVFDEGTVKDMADEGIKALAFMQLSDGGWGWFSGYGESSSSHTTALVVHGLQIARANGLKFDDSMLARGTEWLRVYQDHETGRICPHGDSKECDCDKKTGWKKFADNTDALVFMVLTDAGIKNDKMGEYLFRDRTKLSVYALAMSGIAFQKLGEKEKVEMVLRNIGQFIVEDDENQTAYLNLGNNDYWWHWYGSEYEAYAFYLKLLAAADPKGKIAPKLVKYLLNNRKNSTYWNSTRDTAYCIEAFADYIRASGEDKPDMTVDVVYDGKTVKTVKIDSSNLFSFDNKFILEGVNVVEGKHKIEIRKKGSGPLYFNSYLSYFSLEDFIRRAGLEIKVDRKFYLLKETGKKVKVAGSRGQALEQKVEKYERKEIDNLGAVKSGDLVEVELTIQSKNDYEYLIFEDMKAAGFEPCEVRSGYNGNEMGAYVEFRDEKVCFFVQNLARGAHSVSYRLKAEIPGSFSALPTRGSAMYAPELKANSDEMKISVEE